MSTKTNILLTAAAMALSIALAIAWAGEFAMGSHAGPLRAGLLAAGLAVAGGTMALLARLHATYHRAIIRHFEALCRAHAADAPADADAAIPPLAAGNPWHEIAGHLGRLLAESGRKLEDLQHQRAAMEVRCRRAVSECQQVKTIFARLAEPILAVDDYNELILANQSAGELLQLDVTKSENKALASLVRCEKLVSLLAATAQRKTPGNRTEELEIVDAEGRTHWYRATATKLAEAAPGDAHAESSTQGVVAVLRDIGDQKALQKRNAEFVSSVSHEMKTPLAGIKAYVELLVDGDAEDEETREEFLNVINGQADRLQRLVENLLNLARIEAGVVKVSKQTRPLNELLEESLRVVQPSAETKGITLMAELSPMYLGVLADRDMLLQAAINLLSNAIKYTRPGGRVTLRSRLAGDEVRFEVQDTGVGLSPEDAQRVFEKFYRVKKDKDMAPGTGLGLPLAKHIIEDVHGGRMTVESALDVGSTFICTLPCAKQLS